MYSKPRALTTDTGMPGNVFEMVHAFYPNPALVPLHSQRAKGAQPPYNESAPTGPLIIAPVLTAAAILERPNGERVVVGVNRFTVDGRSYEVIPQVPRADRSTRHRHPPCPRPHSPAPGPPQSSTERSCHMGASPAGAS